MTLKIYNTLIRDKEEFKPRVGKRVYMFVCGPTVYDHSHLGHARTYVAFDVIARYLIYLGYDLFYLMNVTDIDDRMITRANESGMSVAELSKKYFDLFIKDMESLNNITVNLYAKATEHVPEIIGQTKILIENGFAYEVSGNVYFEVRKFTDFGKLSGQDLDALQAGARVEVDTEKRNPEDFVLWKREKPNEPFWESPWGAGRPGWHIEDTAITTKYFGEQYDIHGGARDLIFPHHESEITIAESATGKKPFVKYWLHTGFLNVEGEKMSKSLGNFFTIQDIIEKYDIEVVRFFLLYTHYRSPIDFAEKNLEEASTSFGRLRNSIDQLKSAIKSSELQSNNDSDLSDIESELLKDVLKHREQFLEAMDDDFNTREAIAALFEFSHTLNRYIKPGEEKHEFSNNLLVQVYNIYLELANILGLFECGVSDSKEDSGLNEKLIELLIDLRHNLRAEKNFKIADQLRDQLKELGVILEDTQAGTTWKFE